MIASGPAEQAAGAPLRDGRTSVEVAGAPPRDKRTSVEVALEPLRDGARLMYGGFGGVGSPALLIDAILTRGTRELTLIGNDAGGPQLGCGRLIVAGRVRRMITTHIGLNPVAGQLLHDGELEVEFASQGILAERIRAGGAGLAAVVTRVGVGTFLADGKATIDLDGATHLVEPALRADVAILAADRVDPFGNCTYDKTARNLNPLMAPAADHTIVQAREVVPFGALSPEEIVTPGVFVDAVVTGEGGEWRWPWQ
jgi:acetate CoA/acetoacetate CoA-transferase alpha subunit